jgi:hypothetical protein
MAFKRSPVRSRLAPQGTPLRRGFAFLAVVVLPLAFACASEGGLGDGSPDDGATPLTNARLREVARARGFGAATGPVFNGNVGRAFQRWALAAFPGRSLPENTQTLRSELRERLTRLRVGGPLLGVRPDAIGGAVTLAWAGFPATAAAPREVHAGGSVFVEVKAIKGALTVSHSAHQLSGLIDVAANSVAARLADPQRPTPAVIFITTSDTSISPSLLTEARERGVAIWQAVVFELRGSTVNQPRFGIGPVVPRNPEVYGQSWPQPLPPGPTDVPFPLREPPALPAPGDPDPPEVQ